MKTKFPKLLSSIILAFLIITSCSSDEDNSDNQSSISQSLANTQWVFNSYEFMNDTATQEDIDTGQTVAIGNEFSIEDVVTRTELLWDDFFLSFNDDGTGSTSEFGTTTGLAFDGGIYSMEWTVTSDGGLRIVYQTQDDLDPDVFYTQIINLESISVQDNILYFESELVTRMQGSIANQDLVVVRHYGQLSFN